MKHDVIDANDTDLNRRRILGAAALLPTLSLFGSGALAQTRMRRIAVEEHFMIPEIAQEWRKLVAAGAVDEPGFKLLSEAVYGNPSPAMALIGKRLGDLGDGRLKEMDALGIDMQVVMIGSPGVQILEAGLARSLATMANDRLAAAVRAHPTRFAGLATIAPQDPPSAARELERAVKTLGLRGSFVASHTKGEYLDLEKFNPILEAAEALSAPIYIHPREPAPQMMPGYKDYYLWFAGWGFAAETGLHALRLIFGGAFDRFPKLQIVLGHLGEGVPYWMERVDAYHEFLVKAGQQKRMAMKPSEYFKRNFVVTTSGMNTEVAFHHALEALGADRILFAIDYPYTYGDEDVKFMNDVRLSDSDKQKIFHRNAERVFKLQA